ncbi:hypothetical protein [Ursidibacter sp. B-7004-1]
MIALMILTFFIFVILITIGLAYVVKRKSLRYFIILFLPVISYFTLFFEDFIRIFIHPVYCYIHKDEGMLIHTPPQEWRKIEGKDIVIMPSSRFNNGETSILTDQRDFDFEYENQKKFGNDLYHLMFVNRKKPNLAIYISYNGGLFAKDTYLYYDINKAIILASLSLYHNNYQPLIFHKKNYECKTRNITDNLDKYIDENYTSSE